MNKNFMNEAISISNKNLEINEGGPFGAVIVKDGEIIGRGNNRVTSSNDPTAHAEIVAIRDACKNIGNFSLDGCDIYTSCEPCPMCLSAIYWARIKNIYYSNTRKDAADIGFDDSYIYDQIALPIDQRDIKAIKIDNHFAKEAFESWRKKINKVAY